MLRNFAGPSLFDNKDSRMTRSAVAATAKTAMLFSLCISWLMSHVCVREVDGMARRGEVRQGTTGDGITLPPLRLPWA